jgi:uncharacterized membrane protein YcaP (DUF421 family)
MRRDQLMTQLCLHGITDVGSVARAYLESNRMISVIRKEGTEVEESAKPPAVG